MFGILLLLHPDRCTRSPLSSSPWPRLTVLPFQPDNLRMNIPTGLYLFAFRVILPTFLYRFVMKVAFQLGRYGHRDSAPVDAGVD